MITKRRFLAIIAATGLLPACSVLGPDAPKLFTVKVRRPVNTAAHKADWQLSVEVPTAQGALDSTRIVTARGKSAVEPIADVAWTDRASEMMQGVIVEAFENAGALNAVGRDSMGLRADFVLKSELRNFEAEYVNEDDETPRQVRVRLVAKLMAMPRRSVAAGETFEATAPVVGHDIGAIVLAFDEATGQVLDKLVPWAIQAGDAAHAKPPADSATSTRRFPID